MNRQAAEVKARQLSSSSSSASAPAVESTTALGYYDQVTLSTLTEATTIDDMLRELEKFRGYKFMYVDVLERKSFRREINRSVSTTTELMFESLVDQRIYPRLIENKDLLDKEQVCSAINELAGSSMDSMKRLAYALSKTAGGRRDTALKQLPDQITDNELEDAFYSQIAQSIKGRLRNSSSRLIPDGVANFSSWFGKVKTIRKKNLPRILLLLPK